MTKFYVAENEIQTFVDMKGKKFDFYKADPFVYSPMVFGVVGISVSGETYIFSVVK